LSRETILYVVASLDGDFTEWVLELIEWDQAFGLVADIDYDFRVADLDNFAVDNVAFGEILQRRSVELHHYLGIDLPAIHRIELGEQIVPSRIRLRLRLRGRSF